MKEATNINDTENLRKMNGTKERRKCTIVNTPSGNQTALTICCCCCCCFCYMFCAVAADVVGIKTVPLNFNHINNAHAFIVLKHTYQKKWLIKSIPKRGTNMSKRVKKKKLCMPYNPNKCPFLSCFCGTRPVRHEIIVPILVLLCGP